MANKPPRPITSVADSAVRSSWSFPISNLRLYLPRDPPGERWFRTRASDPASLITHGLSPTSKHLLKHGAVAPLVLCMLGVFEGFTEHDETAISFFSFFCDTPPAGHDHCFSFEKTTSAAISKIKAIVELQNQPPDS